MMDKFIEEIGICRGCFEKPALYYFEKRGFMITRKRWLCKECAKVLSEKENLGINY